MNGQIQKPKNWKEWHDFLVEAVNDLEMQIELVKAQLEVARDHVKK